jgi:hypothetical protein
MKTKKVNISKKVVGKLSDKIAWHLINYMPVLNECPHDTLAEQIEIIIIKKLNVI